MNRTRRTQVYVSVIVGSLLILSFAPATLAQSDAGSGDSLLKQQRLIDEQLDQERKDIAPLDSLLDWQWGGWLEYYFFMFNDGVQSQRVYQRPGMSLWTRLSIDDGAHQIFARMRMTFDYFNPGDEYNRRRDLVGPNLDRGWYQIDVGKAFRLTDPGDPFQLRVRAGRQEVEFGTGYVLDLPLDSVVIDAQLSDFRVVGLIGKTIASYPNIDRSFPVANHSKRCFFGVQVSYEGLENHVPFAYALWNNDRTNEHPKNPLQNYAYDSAYFGLGSRGSIIHNLNYWVEGTFESGHSFGDGDFRGQDRIEAWGFDAGIEYLWDVPTRPFASAEYMFASGDSDRTFSPSSAAGGNYGDRHDTGFTGFGYRDTGLDSGLTNSNLHVWRMGAGFAPLEKIELCRDLEIGTNWFLYQKHHSRGAISDSTAGQFAGYVGWEMDYFVNWRLASDISWTMRWGAFFPGEAYQDRSTRNFLFTGLTWSF